MRAKRHREATILTGETASSEIDNVDGAFASLVCDALTGATLTPQVKIHPDYDDWVGVYDADGTEIVIAAAADRVIRIPDECFPCNKLRFVAASAQAADITIYINFSA